MSSTAWLPGVPTQLRSNRHSLTSLVSAPSLFPRTLVSSPTAQALSLSELPPHPHRLLPPQLLFLQPLVTLHPFLQPLVTLHPFLQLLATRLPSLRLLATLLPQDLRPLLLLLARLHPMSREALLQLPLLRRSPQLLVILFQSPQLHMRPR